MPWIQSYTRNLLYKLCHLTEFNPSIFVFVELLEALLEKIFVVIESVLDDAA